MRSLLTTLAVCVLGFAFAFWLWVERQKPVLPPGDSERNTLIEQLRVTKTPESVSPEVQARAKELGANLEEGRRYLLTSYGVRIDNPNSAKLWSAALSSPGRLYEEKKQQHEAYSSWRLTLTLVAGGAGLLLLALAANQPKPDAVRRRKAGETNATEGGDKPQTNV